MPAGCDAGWVRCRLGAKPRWAPSPPGPEPAGARPAGTLELSSLEPRSAGCRTSAPQVLTPGSRRTPGTSLDGDLAAGNRFPCTAAPQDLAAGAVPGVLPDLGPACGKPIPSCGHHPPDET